MMLERKDLIQSTQSKESVPVSEQSFFKLNPAVLAVVSIIILVGAGLIPRLLHKTALGIEALESAIPKVSVVHPAFKESGYELLLPAEIKPWIETPIYARASGYLKQWFADIGTKVKAGQLLAVIETPEIDQELVRVKNQLAEAEAAFTLSELTAARYAELIKTKSVSEQENAEKQADLQLKSAAVNSAQANLRRLESLQSFSHVTAPFDGTITARKCDIGELISGSGKELFRLSQTEKLRVYVRVPQKYALDILPGQTEELLIPELPDHPFAAKIARTAKQISDDSRTLLTELEVDNQSGEIIAGSFAQLKFVNTKWEPVLTLPSRSVLFSAEGTYVDIVNDKGEIEVRKVKLGRNYGETIEILAGVKEDDKVISNPSQSLTNGTVVSFVEEADSKKGEIK